MLKQLHKFCESLPLKSCLLLVSSLLFPNSELPTVARYIQVSDEFKGKLKSSMNYLISFIETYPRNMIGCYSDLKWFYIFPSLRYKYFLGLYLWTSYPAFLYLLIESLAFIYVHCFYSSETCSQNKVNVYFI